MEMSHHIISYNQGEVIRKLIAMKFFVPIICLFCIPTSVLGRGIIYGDEVSYHDLMRMNASCYPLDSCMEVRDNYNDYPGILYPYTCSCNRQCWQYDTCCIDSPYRGNTPPIYECWGKGMVPNGYFMVQKCSVPIWKSWCEEESNGEDDIIKLSPVTSLDTNTTYKNYYCLRCHETTDNFILWNPSLRDIDASPHNSKSGYRVPYNQVIRTSEYVKGVKPFSNPLILIFEPPNEIRSLAIPCDPDIVSDCPEKWTDKHVLYKCRAYTSIVYSKGNYSLSYKNVHCALCNYESLDNISCERSSVGSGFAGGPDFSNVGKSNIPNKANCNEKQSSIYDPNTGTDICVDKFNVSGK